MSLFDHQRLTNATFKLDIERMRQGWYSDKYFVNIAKMLTVLAEQGYSYQGKKPRLPQGISPEEIGAGDLEVEMQWFTRRPGKTLVVGVDKALTMLRHCTGYWQGEAVYRYLGQRWKCGRCRMAARWNMRRRPGIVRPVLKVQRALP